MAEKLLLVDDEESIRKVLAMNLREAGYEVRTAADGPEALETFAAWHPALVLTDIKMPGMDGLELLERIKNQEPDAEVVMITGHGDLELAIESIKRRAADFVTKPVNQEILEIALARAAERLALRRALREYTANLERLVEEKTRELLAAERLATMGQTAAALAHSIKNIATGLEGAIFLLASGRETGSAEELDQGFEMLSANVARVKDLALELLRLGAPPAPKPAATDPDVPARDVVRLLTPRAAELGLTLELADSRAAGPAWLDAEGLHRVLMNLVTNALEACADGQGSRVTVRVEREPGWWAYTVADDGPGMDEATQARLFTSFFTTKGQGFGLGLVSARTAVEAAGGSIRVESAPGAGAAFTVRLPDNPAPARLPANGEATHG